MANCDDAAGNLENDRADNTTVRIPVTLTDRISFRDPGDKTDADVGKIGVGDVVKI